MAAPRRSGRRPGPSGTREAILAAARRQFAAQGYDRTSMRGIAAEAGVDQALVAHFFGAKQQLFVEVVRLPFEPSELLPVLLEGDRETLGERLAGFVASVLESPEGRARVLGIVRAAASEPEAARMLREFLRGELLAPLAQQLGVGGRRAARDARGLPDRRHGDGPPCDRGRAARRAVVRRARGAARSDAPALPRGGAAPLVDSSPWISSAPASSRRHCKPDERRLAIHPAHLERIDPVLRRRLFLERGYGERFGFSDDAPRAAGRRPALARGAARGVRRDHPAQAAGRGPRDAAPRPGRVGLAALRAGRADDAARDRPRADADRLRGDEPLDQATGNFSVHVFHKNNELAGYCSVLHALAADRLDRRLRPPPERRGDQLRRDRARGGAGAVGARDQRRDGADPARRPPPSPRRSRRCGCATSSPATRWPDVLAEHDIVVNCILQDTDNPLIFVTNDDLARFQRGSLFVDVSCDEGMGFEWARPTTFAEPMFDGRRRPALLRRRPQPVVPVELGDVGEQRGAARVPARSCMSGPAAWDANETIERAIEIREGVIQNPRILSFQQRSPDLPLRRASLSRVTRDGR